MVKQHLKQPTNIDCATQQPNRTTDIVLPYWNEIKNFHQLVIPFLDGKQDANKCRLYKANSIISGKPIITMLDFDTDNRFIQDLLIEFQLTQHDEQPRAYHIEFFRRFAESLDHHLPSNIYEFNVGTLLKQEQFFSAIKRAAELENRLFYRFILEKQGDNKTITINDGISIG